MLWIIENYELLSGLVALITIYSFLRYGAKKDTEKLMIELKELKTQVNGISGRLNRLEGRFDERGIWEARYNGTEKKT